MNEYIDLTENRDFMIKSKNEYSSAIPFNMLKPLLTLNRMELAVPFRLTDRFNVLKDDYYIQRDKGAILQGDKIQRASKIFSSEFGAGRRCDRCSRTLYPYTNNTVCDKCQEDLNGFYITL